MRMKEQVVKVPANGTHRLIGDELQMQLFMPLYKTGNTVNQFNRNLNSLEILNWRRPSSIRSRKIFLKPNYLIVIR
jgi:hypothetical protein